MRPSPILPCALLLAALAWAAAANATPLAAPVATQVAAPVIAAPTLAACDADFQTVLRATPAQAPALSAQAVWLTRDRLRWPQAPAGAVRLRLLQSEIGRAHV